MGDIPARSRTAELIWGMAPVEEAPPVIPSLRPRPHLYLP